MFENNLKIFYRERGKQKQNISNILPRKINLKISGKESMRTQKNTTKRWIGSKTWRKKTTLKANAKVAFDEEKKPKKNLENAKH